MNVPITSPINHLILEARIVARHISHDGTYVHLLDLYAEGGQMR